MKVSFEDTVQLQIGGKTVDATVTVTFDASGPVDLSGVLAQVAASLGTTPRTKAEPPRPELGREAPRPGAYHGTKPDLHAKAMKSVHRVVLALSDAGGKGLSVADLSEKARISLVPAYKMLKDDQPQGKYAANFLRTTKVGRSQIVDLTPEGRQLASLIRAGRVPA